MECGPTGSVDARIVTYERCVYAYPRFQNVKRTMARSGYPGALTDEHVHDAATVVARQLGYEARKYEQLEVVSSVLQGYDVFAILPTGLSSARVFALRAFHRSRPTSTTPAAVYCYSCYSFDS